MKSFTSDKRLVTTMTLVVLLMLTLLPFHAFLTVWLASGVGHYTLLRLWKEILLLLLAGGSAYIVWHDVKLRQRLLNWKLTWLIVMFTGVQLLWGIVSYQLHGVGLKALAYGWLLDMRSLLFLLVVWVIASKSTVLRRYWQPVIFWPAAVVVLIGLLQYFALPYDVLKHFGYGDQTIFPYETINHNVNYIRVMSTLRGANPLGAYLLLVATLALVSWRTQRRWWQAGLGVVSLFVLGLSFSRSAWIGLVLSLGVVAAMGLKTARARYITLGAASVALALSAILALVLLNHNSALQNALLHTDDHSTIAMSSNQGHSSALRSGIKDLIHHPLGDGPGTAGPASVYNNHPGRIAENYYVQIGQETGWIGLLLYLGINAWLARLLWLRRQQPLALGLFAAFVGLAFVNLLSHAWTDDTLAYLFWGLAGIALAQLPASWEKLKR